MLKATTCLESTQFRRLLKVFAVLTRAQHHNSTVTTDYLDRLLHTEPFNMQPHEINTHLAILTDVDAIIEEDMAGYATRYVGAL